MNKVAKIFCITFCAFTFICNHAATAAETKGFKGLKLYTDYRKNKQHTYDNMEKAIKQIQQSINNEEYTSAMLDINKLLNENTDDPRVYVMSADLLRKTYQLDEAELMAKKALQLDYKNSMAYLVLGQIYFDKSQMAANSGGTLQKRSEYLLKSFDHLFMASQYDQSNALPHIALANAYYENKQKNKARDEILKAQELCFEDAKALHEIAQYYYNTGENDKAEKYIRRSIKIEHDYSYKSHYLVGLIYEKNGKIEEAQKEYLKALKLKPDNIEAQKHLDRLIKTSYKKKKAEESLPKDLFAEVDEDLNILLKADYYLMLDEFTRARDLYTELLKKDDKNANAAAGLAELYYSKWREGFSTNVNFTQDAIHIMKLEPTEKNKIALLKFQSINESKLPEKVRRELINLSISETFEFYDLLNEVRAEFLLGNYEECHNKLYRLLSINLSNYEKFKILKHLCYDHNYYEALIVLNDLKRTYYHNEEIMPVEKRINDKIAFLDEKMEKALEFWEQELYHKSLDIYNEIIHYFPTYKSVYLHYALSMEHLGDYEKAYDFLNKYEKLYALYPERDPEISETELKELKQGIYTKIQEQSFEEFKK